MTAIVLTLWMSLNGVDWVDVSKLPPNPGLVVLQEADIVDADFKFCAATTDGDGTVRFCVDATDTIRAMWKGAHR